ncbi:hypothetical protein MBLNU459_g1592t1 [Dothideomycetes sp. NU459]
MPLRIETTRDPAEAPILASLYFSAFQNPHSLACWPRDSPSVQAWWSAMLAREMRDDAGTFFLKIVDCSLSSSSSFSAAADGDPAGATGQSEEIVAWAVWSGPGAAAGEQGALEWPEGADVGLCEQTFGAWERERARIMGEREHWYLKTLATHPSHQGRGAGSMLIGWGLDRADEDGLEAYLEASPTGE